MAVHNLGSLHAHVAHHIIPVRNALQGQIAEATESTDVLSLLTQYTTLLSKVRIADEWIDANRTSLSGNGTYYQIRRDITQTVSLIDGIRSLHIGRLSNRRTFASAERLHGYVAYYVIPETYALERAIEAADPGDAEAYMALLATYDTLQQKAHKAGQWIAQNLVAHQGTLWEHKLTFIKKDLNRTLKVIEKIRGLHITPLSSGVSSEQVRSYVAYHITPFRLRLEAAIREARKADLGVNAMRGRISTLLYLDNDLMRRMTYVTRYLQTDPRHVEASREVRVCREVNGKILRLSEGVFALTRRTLGTLQTDATDGEGAIRHPPIGIRNQWNNCWVNALMQWLINVPIFRMHLLSNLPEEYRYFASRYLTDRIHGLSATGADSQAIRMAISEAFSGIISPDCWNSEDASEAFMLLRGLVNEGERINARLPMSPENSTLNPLFHWIRTTRHYQVTPMISPYLGSSTCDLDREGRSVRYDPEMQIIPHLPNRESISFETLMDSFFHDHIESTEQGRYNNIALDVRRISRAFLTPPEHLTVTPKRFRMLPDGSFQKIYTRLDIPELYTLPAHYTENGQAAQYQLKGIIQHIGGFTEGHYIAYIRDDRGVWMKCNDQFVTPATPAELENAKQTSYFTYFEKQTDLTEEEALTRIESRRTHFDRAQVAFPAENLRDEITALRGFNELLHETDNQTKLRSAFAQLPSPIKDRIYRVALAQDNRPSDPLMEGKRLVNANMNLLLGITTGWLSHQRENLIEQFIYLKERELALIDIQMHILEDIENEEQRDNLREILDRVESYRNQTWAEELRTFQRLLHNHRLSEAQRRFSFMNLSQNAEWEIFQSLPNNADRALLEGYENIAYLRTRDINAIITHLDPPRQIV